MSKVKWIAGLILITLTNLYRALRPIEVECTCDNCDPCSCDDCEWDGFKVDAYNEYADEFTAIFNAIEYKVARNGRSMVKSVHGTSFKFI